MFVMTYSFSKAAMASRARVQAHRSSSVLALQEGVSRAVDHHSSGCLPAEKFPTFASSRQGRGPTTLSNFRGQFHLIRPRDVAGISAGTNTVNSWRGKGRGGAGAAMDPRVQQQTQFGNEVASQFFHFHR